jgi:hypothetical protein
LLEPPLIQTTHLLQVLCALLPGTLPIVFTPAKFDLTLAPGLFFAPPPLVPLLIREPGSIAVVPRQTILLTVAPIVVTLPVPALFCLLAILCPSLLVQNAALVVILATRQLVLTFGQTALLLGLASLLKQTLFFLGPPLIVVSAALPSALSIRFGLALLVELPAVFLLALPQLFLVGSFLFASLLVCQTSLLVGLTALGILILAGLFGLSSLFLFLAPLFPLLSLLRTLLLLTLAFGLIRLATLILGLTFIVAALLFGLALLLSFFVAPVLVLILLVLVPLPFFTSHATIFTVGGLLGSGKTGGSQQSR